MESVCKAGEGSDIARLEQRGHLHPAYYVALENCLSLSVPQAGMTVNFTVKGGRNVAIVGLGPDTNIMKQS